ncbi:ATP-binding protein [Nonomuraea sp. NPDC003214]
MTDEILNCLRWPIRRRGRVGGGTSVEVAAVPATTNRRNGIEPPAVVSVIAAARLYRSAKAPQRGRQLITTWLGGDDHVLPDALQIVSELVANGVVHPSRGSGREWLVVSVSRGDGFVLLEVTDPGIAGTDDSFPAKIAALGAESALLRESGRGLGLVAAFSQSWGTYTNESGHRVVWAALAAGGRS